MNNATYKRHCWSFSLLVIFAFSLHNICAQTIKERLEQQTEYIPQASSPVEQLIETARQFKIPMAIEWLEPAEEQAKRQLAFRGGAVHDLVEAIVRQSPEHQILIEDQILYIYPPAAISHPFNFLNLRIPNYDVRNESLFVAEAALRTGINMKLYPELYRNGYGGGTGGAYPHAFWEENITLSGRDMTIREILTGIAAQSRNACWIVRLKQEEFIGYKPKWIGVPQNPSGHSPINYRWQFIALND